MTTSRAFPYLRYDPDVTGDPGVLLAPPYDVMSAEHVAELAARSPYQSCVVESGFGDDTAAAGAEFRRWIVAGALVEGEVGVAVVKQRFVGPDGVRRTRTGVVCEVGLSPFGAGEVLPHEQTFEAPRRLRQRLMEDSGANLSPVFLLYHDPEQSLTDLVASITDEEPDYTGIEDDDVQTAVWFVTDLALLERFEQAASNRPLLIADGHHRYTAALGYQESVRTSGRTLVPVGGPSGQGPHTDSSGPDGVLAVVSNSADEGIEVFPTHRLVHGVDPQLLTEFVVGSGALHVTAAASVSEALAALERLPTPGFVVYQGGQAAVYAAHDPFDLELALPDVSPEYRTLDVAALHGLMLDGGAVLTDHADRIAYTRSVDEAVAAADADLQTIAFLLRGAPVATVHAVAAAGDLLPQKSTYFFPKVPTGVLFRRL